MFRLLTMETFTAALKCTTGYCYAFHYYIVVDDKQNKLVSMKKIINNVQ